MEKIKIGVLCPSEIAFRRFMPALKKLGNFEYTGLAAATEREFSRADSDDLVASELEKASKFADTYGGKIFHGYESLISSDEIDAVYIPLPPGLHFRWAKAALEAGKHVLLEKPFTVKLQDTETLIELARSKNLAVHENYMFAFHSQIDWIKQKLSEGAVGDIRIIRIDFGFPFRGTNDFRYDSRLGGGALYDCGGYTLKLAQMFLGETARITTSQLNCKDGFDVDIFGSATLVNDDGLTAQVSFGMDNDYRCSLDVWGSKGTLSTGRILTAPEGFEPSVKIRIANEEQMFTLAPDDTFRKSIAHFGECIESEGDRFLNYKAIRRQSELVEQFVKRSRYDDE